MVEKDLCRFATEARQKAYAPYSGYTVGAALLTADGDVYVGCNIENAAFTPTVCAERTAVFKAVSEGHREFAMLAISGGKGDGFTGGFPPCGVCRQVLAEFCSLDFPILVVMGEDSYVRYTLGELLPHGFGPSHVEEGAV